MVPLLSFSNSHCGSDNTTQRGGFLLVVVCVFVNCTVQPGVKLKQCGLSGLKPKDFNFI